MNHETIEITLDECRTALDSAHNPFNEWEENFLFSILNQWDEQKWLSLRQQDTLQKMKSKIKQ